MVNRIVVTPGEPAGVGPELMYHLAKKDFDDELVIIGSKSLLKERFDALNLNVTFKDFDKDATPVPSKKGELTVLNVDLAVSSAPGKLDPKNGPYVLKCLDIAHELCISDNAQALVTGPVSKAVLDSGSLHFTGHTEYLQQKSGVKKVVMLLGSRELRVALATTHLPLNEVSKAITKESLTDVISILHHDLKEKFGFADPTIYVAGLNPHAGENGHLGSEEITTIIPVLNKLRKLGMKLEGPYPADTIFQPKYLNNAAAFLTMYHDQGLPVLKYAAFDHGYNTTLGLPYIRTSVDHGTALDLAGSGKADPGSLYAAVALASFMAKARRK